MTTTTTVAINEIPLDPLDATKTIWGGSLAAQYYFVIANGTAAAEYFDAADLSDNIRALMAQHKRGLLAWMGDGDDTVTGSGYGDTITAGDGINRIDGGGNAGPASEGGAARDVLNVFAKDQAAADALGVTALDANATGADLDAYNQGYRIKVSNGAETDYVKNIEQVNIFLASGSYVRTVRLAVDVYADLGGQDPAGMMHLAWVQGSGFNDSFNAATDIPAATRTLMEGKERGVWIDLGAGNDTVTGSGYGDDITAGSGTNYVDGGANAGSPPWGGKAQDVLHVTVANQAAADAVQVTELKAGATGADAEALANGYTFKVTAGGETDYVKGIERISVQIDTGNGGSNWVRDIPLTVVAQEAKLSASDIDSYYHLAWVNGTANNDTIDVSAATSLLSADLKAAMTQKGRGVWIDGGAGDDTITGSAYADNFRNGAGNSKIDGGANTGGQDVFEIAVGSVAEMNAVKVEASDNDAYTWMVTYGSGTQKDYLKNVEAITVNVTGTNTGKWIPLAVQVQEIAPTANLDTSMHYAWAQGTSGNDTVDAADISANTKVLMSQKGRGFWADTGAGDDTITGSAYGDDITAGTGVNHVDGGANAGSPPWGGNAQDVLHVVVADQVAAGAVLVTQLSAGMSGADATAFANGYTHKVTAGGETDYVKGIERISVQIDTGNGGSNWVRDIPLTVVAQEANLADANINNYYHLAWVNGTANNDTIDLSAATSLLSAELKAAMSQKGRGVWIDGGAGDDTITGSAYADNFRNGAGNSKIDGGANTGGQDVFEIAVGSVAEMNAVKVEASDNDAYTWMVTYGSGTQKDYLKNVEAITVNVTGTNTGKWIPLAVQVQEIAPTANLDASMHYAWAQGTGGADTVNAAANVSAATRDLMNQHGRGIYVDTGAGDDTITGSGFGDDINAGSGTNYVDGGASAGSPPWGGKAQDVLHVTVADQAAANAVQVTELKAGLGGADAEAFANGYTHKVSAGGETDYVKGIERVSIELANAGGGSTWVRDVPLTVVAQEANLQDANIGNYPYLGWVTGTAGGDTIDLGGDTALLSAPLKAAMAQKGRGIWIDAGAGDDTISGTDFGDNIVAGGGINYVDGGAQAGTQPGGGQALDRLEVYVASQAAADAVAVVQLSATMQGADGAAYAAGYRYKVSNGALETDYVKNVEQVSVIVWNDKDGDGVRDGAAQGNPANELTPVRTIALGVVPNTAPTFTGAPAGVAVYDAVGGGDFGILGATILPNGKMLGLSYLGDIDTGVYSVMLVRANADGSTDTSFGGGTGAVVLPTAYGAGPEPVVQADGKIVVGLRSPVAGELKLMRFNADGSLDAGFGTGGASVVTVGTGTTVARKLLVDSTGKLVLVGQTATGTNSDMVVIRLNANGSLDTSFNLTGKLVLAPSSGNDIAYDAVFQADGKLLLAGVVVGADGSQDWAVLRLNQDGSYDSTFGNGGKLVLPIGASNDVAWSLQTLANGKIVVAGSTRTGDASSDTDQVLMRLNSDGTPDANFGSGGKVVSHLSDRNELVGDMQVQADGKIVVLSATNVGPNNLQGDFAVTRYNADGSLDASFGNGGTARLTVHGVGESGASLALVGGKIVVFGSTYNGTNFSTSSVIYRLNNDGSLDTSFAPHPVSSLGGTVRSDGMVAVVLDANAAIYDAELAAKGNYSGASLVLARHGGASGDDVFAAAGDVSFAGGNLAVGGTVIGTVSQAGGALTLNFSSAATQGLVNRALHGITYLNGSATAPEQVTIDWTFSDGNDGSQGTGGAKGATGSTTVQIGVAKYEAVRSAVDPTMATSGQKLSAISYMANVIGSARGDSFDAATGFSSASRGLMDEFKRGAVFDMRAGNDDVKGTGYSDVFIMGTGVNRVDGGANAGTLPGETAKGRDILNVYVANDAQAGAVSATVLTGAATGEDATAFAAGYTVKVVNGAETDYLKNVESVNIFKWNDANGNGTRDANETSFVREILLATRVFETTVSATDATKTSDGRLLADVWHLANANGGNQDDSFNAATDVSATTQALMAKQGRGVWVDGGAGNDTLVGSAYGDNFIGGAGVNRIDGGANGGTDPNGNPASDTLEVFVANQAAADAVTVTALTAGMSGADGDAYAQGYRHKVVNGTAETDYVKNVEQLNIQIWNDKDGDGQRDFSSDAAINEVTYARGVQLASVTPPPSTPNTAPVFGAPAGMGIVDVGYDLTPIGGVIRSDGKLVALATMDLVDEGGNYVLALVRRNADGTADTSFGGSGHVTLPTTFGAVAKPAVQADGKIVVAVSTDRTNASDFKIVRFNADGSLDTSFGTNGETVVGLGSLADSPVTVLVDANGKIVVAGSATSSTDRDFAVVRLNTDGSLDTGFNGSGKLIAALPAGRDAPTAAAFDAQGGIILVGSSQITTGSVTVSDTSVIRVNPNGTLDTTFAGGKTFLPMGQYNDFATSVTVLSSGKILVGGDYVVNPANNNDTSVSLMKLNADGSLDTSFGTGGIVSLAPTGAGDRIREVLEQADGKIVVSGWVNGTGNNGGQMAVVRFNADGSLDTSFGTDGSTRIPLPGLDSRDLMLKIVAGKIVLMGASSFNTNFDANMVLARLNLDGSFDTSYKPVPGGSLGSTLRADGIHPVVLDFNAVVYDAELSARGNYGGASLTLSRHGGASADDHFASLGELGFDAGNLSVAGVLIGSVEQAGGTLTLHFNGNATQALVTRALHGIGYANGAASPGTTVTIDWLFSDNNDGSQGLGGAQSGTGSTVVQIGVTIDSLVRAYTDPTRTADGQSLATVDFLSTIYGTTGADNIPLTILGNDTLALMDQFKHGIEFDLGAGDDTVTGSAYSDWIVGGSGTNRIDGGANAGSVFGGEGRDMLIVYARSQAEANAVTVIRLEAGMSGADATAFAAGYEAKVVNGSEIDYIKNVENIDIHMWTDTNGNGLVDGAEGNYLRSLQFRLHLDEIQAADANAGQWNFAWANGTSLNDSFNAVTDVSAATQALMTQYQRGVYADLGAGNDSFVGSAYGDNISAGAGINRIDGGANQGSDPGGNPAHDFLTVYVGSADAAKAVTAVALSAGSSGTDLDAFNAGYTYKIGAGAETDYLRGVELVDVAVWNDANANGNRDQGEVAYAQRIALAVDIGELKPSAADPAKAEGGTPFSQFDTFAWIDGTRFGETVAASQLLSAATLARMAEYGRGVSLHTLGGGDTVTGTDYGDLFLLGKGVNYVDGGTQLGSYPWGQSADILDIYVGSQAELEAVQLVKLTGALTGLDATAQAAGYQYKIVAGAEIDYLKGIEQYNVSIWDDKNGDGVANSANANDPANEITGSVYIQIADATPAGLVGVPPVLPAV
jgi:uncharacterized delta-60 repeat protein